VAADEGLLDSLLSEAAEHAERVELETVERADLVATGRPVLELPALVEGIDLAALYDLAGRLREQGVRRAKETA